MARPEKVAAVEEIQERLSSAGAAVLTEYRGLSVTELAQLRATLRDAEAQYRVYKNTLARRAAEAADIDAEFTELLIGPTAFAFVDGDVVGAAKALSEFAKTNDKLVIKGGLLDGRFIDAAQVGELASLPSREELLAKMAGAFKAPMAKAAGLFSALQRNTAYAIKALIDKRVEAGEEAPPDESADEPQAATEPEAGAGEGAADDLSGSSADEPQAATEPEAGAGEGTADDSSGSSADESAEDQEPEEDGPSPEPAAPDED